MLADHNRVLLYIYTGTDCLVFILGILASAFQKIISVFVRTVEFLLCIKTTGVSYVRVKKLTENAGEFLITIQTNRLNKIQTNSHLFQHHSFSTFFCFTDL